MLWDEYTRDNSSKLSSTGTAEPDLIKSKHFLKERVLATMLSQGKIERTRAADIQQYKNSGWKLVTHKAFHRVDPSLLAKMQPLPQIKREDYKEYLRQNNIPYEFWGIWLNLT